MLTATMVGALGGPALVSAAEGIAGRMKADELVVT